MRFVVALVVTLDYEIVSPTAGLDVIFLEIQCGFSFFLFSRLLAAMHQTEKLCKLSEIGNLLHFLFSANTFNQLLFRIKCSDCENAQILLWLSKGNLSK